jgi:hypothetical protein
VGFDRAQMKVKAAEFAAKGVFIGTSSWKYEGWLSTQSIPNASVRLMVCHARA